MKHFNQGTVWGKINELTQRKTHNDKPYLWMEILCDNPDYGQIKTYGRVFGKDKVEELKNKFKENPDALYMFKGLFHQFEKDEKILSNYTFFQYSEIVDGKQDPRAAFILKGDVKEINTEDDLYLIKLNTKIELGDNENETLFHLYSTDPEYVKDLIEGKPAEVKGYVRPAEDMDEFGSNSGRVKPFIFKAKVLAFDNDNVPF